MVCPAVDKAFSGEFSHSGCAEFRENREHGSFVKFDAQITKIFHRAFDADLVWFFYYIV